MESVMKYGKFVLGVAASMLLINQIGPLRDIVNKNYFDKG